VEDEAVDGVRPFQVEEVAGAGHQFGAGAGRQVRERLLGRVGGEAAVLVAVEVEDGGRLRPAGVRVAAGGRGGAQHGAVVADGRRQVGGFSDAAADEGEVVGGVVAG